MEFAPGCVLYFNVVAESFLGSLKIIFARHGFVLSFLLRNEWLITSSQ